METNTGLLSSVLAKQQIQVDISWLLSAPATKSPAPMNCAGSRILLADKLSLSLSSSHYCQCKDGIGPEMIVPPPLKSLQSQVVQSRILSPHSS